MNIKSVLLSVAFAAITTTAFGAVNLAPGKIYYLHEVVNRGDNADQIFNGIVRGGNVLVDFYADWCGPCKRLGQALPGISRDFPNIVILKVNTDQFGSISQRYGVRGIPAMLCFKNGQMKERITGFNGAKALKKKLSHVY